MSVLKNLRSLSSMEFYKNAIELRKAITMWMVRDFGTRRNARSVASVIKNIDDADKHIIDEVFAKYGKTPNHEFQSEYPSWFVDFERNIIMKILQSLIYNITMANSIYPIDDFLNDEYALRRKYQDVAISECYALLQEVQYIVACFDININKLQPVLDKIETEVDLLKGWRQSDNKKRKDRLKKIEKQK